MKTCWEEGNQMCQQQDMRTQVADPAPVPFSPRGRRARDEGANFTADIDNFDQAHCIDKLDQTTPPAAIDIQQVCYRSAAAALPSPPTPPPTQPHFFPSTLSRRGGPTR